MVGFKRYRVIHELFSEKQRNYTYYDVLSEAFAGYMAAVSEREYIGITRLQEIAHDGCPIRTLAHFDSEGIK